MGAAGQGQAHTHDHAAGAGRSRLLVVLSIAALIFVVEVIGALISGSLSLLADAGHMLTDIAGLALAVTAATFTLRPADDRRTWGYRRAEVLSAAAQASVLLVVGVVVLVFAVRHLVSPAPVSAGAMGVFGALAIVGNVASLGVLAGAREQSMNLRAAFLEVLNDALGGVAVAVAAAVIAATGFRRADALASVLIAVLILPRTVQLLRETIDVLLESAPAGVDLADVRTHVLEVDHVIAVHDLHATTITRHLPVLTAHVVVEDGCFLDGHCPTILDQLQSCLAGHFDVEHSTFQFEPATHAEHEHAHD